MAEVIIVEDARAGGALVGRALADQLREQPDLVLGLATGSTPSSTYAALAEIVRAESIPVDRLTGFALDEYVGLPAGHPESYREVLIREVVAPLGLDPSQIHVPEMLPDDPQRSGEVYEAAIDAAGGVDVQLLGIGRSGHIGFNEPGSSLASRTRIKTLTEHTRVDNSRFFDSLDDVPIQCMTQGVGTILRAKRLVMLAFGAAKAEGIAAAIEGPLTAAVPASAIQLHEYVTVVVDEAAASRLEHTDSYRSAWAHKPAWQSLLPIGAPRRSDG